MICSYMLGREHYAEAAAVYAGCVVVVCGVRKLVSMNAMWVFNRGDVTSLLLAELVTMAVLILKSGVVGQHS